MASAVPIIILIYLSWGSPSVAAQCSSLAGNWTAVSLIKGGVATVHIEIFQREGDSNFTIWSTPWDARGLFTRGTISETGKTATWSMVGAGPSTYSISASTLVPNAPPCTLLSCGWCKFPFCGVPEPRWAPWGPAKPFAPRPPAQEPCLQPKPTVPDFISMLPPFPPTWVLRSSTIVHTSNKSGWTDSAEASKYGIVSFDWNNAKELWMRPHDPNSSSCEAALLEQARRVKATGSGTRVLLYRNVMWALQWMESERGVMYSPAYAGFFLRYKHGSGAIWRKNLGSGAGEGFLWNFTNATAAEYFEREVVFSQRGATSVYTDGMFFDDPGPPMGEWFKYQCQAWDDIGLTAAEAQALGLATHQLVTRIRNRMQALGKIIWLNGIRGSTPFDELEVPAQFVSSDSCVNFYREHCRNSSEVYRHTTLGVSILGKYPKSIPPGQAEWRKQIVAMLLLRQRHAYLVTSQWFATDAATRMPWDELLERDYGTPESACVESGVGVFERRWSVGVASIDCNNGSIELPGDK